MTRRGTPLGGSRPAWVLLTDAEERATLAAGRCLTAAGYQVAYAASGLPAPAFVSRSSHHGHRHVVPDPREAPDAYVAALAEILAAHRYAMVLPGGDASLRVISQYRHELEPFTELALPDRARVTDCLSKVGLQEATRRSSLRSPETIECTTVEQARAAARELGYPVALKPPSTVFSDGRVTRQRPSIVARDVGTLSAYAEACNGRCLVQRCVAGSVFSFFGVAAEEGLLAYGLSQYLRTWPPAGGNVASAVTVAAPPALVAAVESFVETVGWRGVFELELVHDAGSFMAIDLNPRLYGSLALAVAAGAPLPAVWCDRVLRERIRPPVVARPGVSYRWEDAELRHLVWQLRHRHLRAALAVVAPQPRATHAHLRMSDPLPLLARFRYLARDKHRRRPSPASLASSRRTPAEIGMHIDAGTDQAAVEVAA